MKARKGTQDIRKFKVIRLLAIFIPIIGWFGGIGIGFLVGRPFDVPFADTIHISCYATSIVLCIYYLANLKKTDGKIWAVSICVWLVIMAVLSTLNNLLGG